MLIFDFGRQGRICISIEVRYRKGQKFNLLRSLYRQQELIYVVCDERDAVLRITRSASGKDVCHLYRLIVEPAEVRDVLLEYVASINRLVGRPQWYHGFTANCTTSVYRQRSGKMPWDWRLLLNGRLDRLLYDRGRLDRSIPFDDLKRCSRIDDLADRAPREGFGDYLRDVLRARRGGAEATGTGQQRETTTSPT
jgi:hypothetical protein